MKYKILSVLAGLLALWSTTASAEYTFNPFSNKQDYYQGYNSLHPYFADSDHQHPEYIPTSYVGHTHPVYDPTTENGYTPWSIGSTNQHDLSYAGLTDFQTLYGIATTNQHPESYADINHQHPIYVPFTDLTKQHIATGANAEFVSTHVAGIPMPDVFDTSNHYTGFEDHDAGTLSFNNGTNTFTFTGTAPIWIDGRRYTFNTDSVQITDATGLYWIYIDLVNGVPDLLMAQVVPDQFGKCLVGTVYWNTTTNTSLIGGERHWMGRDKWWHEYTHETIGARYYTGFTGTFTNTTMSITDGEFYDEDIEHEAGSTQTTADILYKNGLATYEFDLNQTTPYKAIAGVLQYNNGNTLTAVGNNQYVAYWVYGTSSTTQMIQILTGQRTDGTIANARTNNTPDTLSLGTLPSPEMKLLYRVIYRNVGGTATYIETADYRNVTPVPNGAFTPTDHSTLSKLNWSQAAHSFDTDLDVQPYDVKANNMHTTVTTGVAPYQTESTTLNVNLNADLLDGYHANALPYSGSSHQHDAYYPSVASFQTLYGIATTNTHAEATAIAAGFVEALSGVASQYYDGSGNWSTPASGLSGHVHPIYDPTSANGYTPMSVYGIHAHPNYQTAGSYADATHNHATYYIDNSYKTGYDTAYTLSTTNTHALATTSADGFLKTLSNTATQYMDGTGNWSTPAGGGGGGTTIGSVPFQALAAPQALQGIEQLRHTASAYQNYGEIIVDGLYDETGTRGPAYRLSYTGSSSYQYSLETGNDASAVLICEFDGANGTQPTPATTGQTISYVGGPTITTADKALGTASIELDGGSQYCSVPDADTWNFGSGKFTVDWWMKMDSFSSPFIIAQYASNNYWGIYVGTTFLEIHDYNAGYNIRQNCTSVISTGQWYHCAIVRNGTTNGDWYFFLNGQLQANNIQTGSGNAFGDDQTSALYIGTLDGSGNLVDGKIDELRISKGVARWTANFTPPTQPYSVPYSEGYMHTLVYPMTITPTHAGVVVKMDSSFTSDQHSYLKVDVSRDGVSYTDCHPITKIGTAGYYRAEMANVSGTGASATAKITLSGSTTKTLKGYGIYAE